VGEVARDHAVEAPLPRARPDELAHYAKKAFDIEYELPFGWQEFEGIHNRTDFDLSRHQEHSGKRMEYIDPAEKGKRYLPYIIETSAGADRTALVVLADAYREEEVEGEQRVVLGLHPKLAPIKAAIFPLVKKDGLPEIAEKITRCLQEGRHQLLLRRERLHREALPSPGRGRHPLRHHRRRPDLRGPDGHRPRPGHAPAGARRHRPGHRVRQRAGPVADRPLRSKVDRSTFGLPFESLRLRLAGRSRRDFVPRLVGLRFAPFLAACLRERARGTAGNPAAAGILDPALRAVDARQRRASIRPPAERGPRGSDQRPTRIDPRASGSRGRGSDRGIDRRSRPLAPPPPAAYPSASPPR
jgi:hypothetical protein